MGKFPFSKQDRQISFRCLQIEVSYINNLDTNHIMYLWALFGSRFLIIFRISPVEKLIIDRDLCYFVRVAGSSLSLLTIEHWSLKKLLKIIAFSLKSVTNLSWCSSGRMQGIYLLFRNVFNIDQYDFWLVLGSNSLCDKRV